MSFTQKNLKCRESVAAAGPENAEVVEEAVETAGDFNICECYRINFKRMLKLIKLQEAKHFTCTICPWNRWVGLCINHLNIHQTNIQYNNNITEMWQLCLNIPDAMSKNVHTSRSTSFSVSCAIKKIVEINTWTLV